MIKEDEKYHVTKKASISTLTGIVNTGMYNYGDTNSIQYIFTQQPMKKQQKSLPAVAQPYCNEKIGR